MMPQRISDEELRDKLAIYLCMPAPDALLDLRDAREALKMAVKGLKLVADQNDAAYPKQIAQTYLDLIEQLQSNANPSLPKVP